MSSDRMIPVVALFALMCASVSFAQTSDAPGDVVAALRNGQGAEALSRIELYLARTPQNPTLLALKGMALARLDRLDEALRAFDAALESRPDFLAALQASSELEYRTHRPGARARLDRLLAVDPGNTVAHAMAGALHYEQQDYASALEHFMRAGAAVRENEIALWQFAHCLFVAGRPAEAASLFEQLLARVEAEAARADPVRYNLALAYLAAGEHAKAVPLLEPLSRREPPDADVLALLADAYQSGDRLADAVAVLRRATTLFPKTEVFYARLGALCLERESFALAREIAEIGLRHVPESAKLLALHGIILSQLGEYDQAQADFKRAADLEPEQPAAVAGISLSLQQGGQTAESIELLRRQTRKHPYDALAHLLLGQALMRGGLSADLPEAQQALERAVASDPRLPSARTELGKLYLKMGHVEQAIEQLMQAASLNATDKQAMYQLLVALRRAGRDEEARQLAVRVRTLLDDEKSAEVARNRVRLMKAGPGR
jgi:tetratricopeptide (TPR) repeat protein